MQDQLESLILEAEQEIKKCSAPNDILNVKAKFLGKKSVLNGKAYFLSMKKARSASPSPAVFAQAAPPH